MAISRLGWMTMCVVLGSFGPAHAAPRPGLTPMTRADGEVCDLLRAQAKDRCQAIAQDGSATVYQSGGKSGGIRRVVLAIDAGDDVLVSPAIDIVADRLESSLRTTSIDGRPGLVLDVVSGSRASRVESTVSCAPVDGLWRCARADL